MSASNTPVVSPRKGRHTRSQGATLSQSTFSSYDSASRFGAAQAALPLGIDPLTLDPDDAFVKLSVREIQLIEANLQSSHDALSSKLRSLVSERYRDMLGTANTLIEMSSSATNLVQRLDAVREGIDHASIKREMKEEHTSATLLGDYIVDEKTQSDEEKKSSTVFSIAAATKLLAEAPDDAWRAIDSASVNSVASGSGKKALQGRDLSNFKAATSLRAAWIYILCQEGWNWLSDKSRKAALTDELDAEALFPYISKQWITMSPMRTSIANVAQSGLAGWYHIEPDSGKRWDEVSSSYVATITFLLTLFLLENKSLTYYRDQFLQNRKGAIEEQLRRGRQASSVTLVRLMKCMADTMIHSLRAFVLIDGTSGLPNLASHLRVISADHRQEQQQRTGFPPLAHEALSTLPSTTLFLEHLPPTIRHFTPSVSYNDSTECQQSTPEALRQWSKSIREHGMSKLILTTINELSTIASIGEAQSQLWESLDQSLIKAEKNFRDKDVSHYRLVEDEMKQLVEMLDGLLLQRLDSLCNDHATELSEVVSHSTSSALAFLKDVEKHSEGDRRAIALESNPLRFVFEADTSMSNINNLLRIQTPLVSRVVSSLEEKAQSLIEEIEEYTSYVQIGALRREKRMQRRSREQEGQSILKRQEQKTKEVLDSYKKAFKSARMSVVKVMILQLEGLRTTASVDLTSSLLLARIASAMQHSEALQGANNADDDDDEFSKGLNTLRKQIIDDWVAHIVKAAIAQYTSKVKVCLDPQVDEQGRPTSALVESLLKLVDGIHAVGCGYSSEMTLVGQQIFFSFVDSWLELQLQLQGKDKSSYVYDSRILLVLLRGSRGVKDDVVDRLEELSGESQAIDQAQIEIALQRLRLLLLPLRPHLALSSSSIGDKSRTDDMTTLPRLSPIKGR